MKNFLMIAMVLISVSQGVYGSTLSGKVVAVVDGNTIQVKAEDNEVYQVSMAGIDCPEIGQEFGERAKSFLSKLILDKTVQVELKGKDRWGNHLGVVMLDGKDPRYELLEAGLAWTAERNPVEEFEALKETAKSKRKGLWKDPDPTPPWIFRRQQSMSQPKSS